MAVDAVIANKFRSFLTALGIIFGVGAVIAMLAIGSGARKEIVDQMKYVGVNNILITPKGDIDAEQTEGTKSVQQKFSRGLTMADAIAISTIPTVADVCSEVAYDVPVVNGGKSENMTLTGVSNSYFSIFNINLSEGNIFNDEQVLNGATVCVIGANVKSKFFTDTDPIGKYLKCGNVNFKVIGVIEKMLMTADNNFGISNYNEGIYAPIQSVFLRYEDRSVITSADLQSAGASVSFYGGGAFSTFSSSTDNSTSTSHNQLDKITVHVDNTDNISQTTDVVTRMIRRLHSEKDDFNVVVPETLLKQEQRTKDIFNIVLGAIAGISLIVGGIGIMNIMLASVMERTKEIGTRLAIGATKKDIIFQFLAEAIIISLIGGIIGVFAGIAMAKIITYLTDILTIVSFSSIIISFGVSATIGICFGYMPAKKAASQNPVESLRYE